MPPWSHRAATALGTILVIAGIGSPDHLAAAEIKIGGYLGAELRIFPQSPRFDEQNDATLSPSLVLEPEFTYETDDGLNRFAFVPFGRIDAHDDNRTHADIREAKYLRIGDGWDAVVGIDRVFWGVTESRHLIDIINQKDGVEDIDEEDKLGQPMLNLNLVQPWGTTRLYVLPGFRERTFPDDDGRLRGPLPIDDDNPEYESGAEWRHVDLAARYTHSFRGVDFGLAHFWGTSREPRFETRLRDLQPVLVPVYDIIHQTSLDAQYTTGPLQLKLEAITRSGQGDRFWATVAGLEYTLFDVAETGSDVGLLVEHLWDDRDEDTAPPTSLDNDLFFGLRFTANDRRDTQMLAGFIVDLNGEGSYGSLEFSTRLTDRLRLEIEARGFFGIEPGNPIEGIDKDDFIMGRLKLSF